MAAIIPIVLFYSINNLNGLITLLMTRLMNEFDIYIQMSSISTLQIQSISERIDPAQDFIGSLSSNYYNFASYIKSAFTGDEVNPTGPNPRLFAYINLIFGNESSLIINTGIAVGTLYTISRLRKKQLKESSLRSIIMLISTSQLCISSIADITRMKYALITLFLTSVLTKTKG